MTNEELDDLLKECTCGRDEYKTCFCTCGWLREYEEGQEVRDDLKIEDEQELKVNVEELDEQTETVENSIFKPKPKVNISLVGNVKDNNEVELIRFIKSVSSNNIFVITREFGKNSENEHLHFYIEKTDIQLNTIKKKLTNDSYFKKLKGKSAGGEHKYNIKTMTEKIQFYYIFKEIPKAITHEKNTKRLYCEGVTITPAMVDMYKKQYDECCEHKKLSASNKFFYWVKKKYPNNPNYYKDKEKLIDSYLDYSSETNRAVINKFDCEKMINYVILRNDPDQLKEEFKRYLCPTF